MEHAPRTQARLTQYLLGRLPEVERDRLEEEYFVNDELFGELLEAEEQLIDDYLRDRLSVAERERFERHFLTQPDRRRRVEFERMLGPRLARPARVAKPEEPWWRSALDFWRALGPAPRLVAAALLLLAVGGGWAVVRISRLERLLDQSRAQQAALVERAERERVGFEGALAALQARAPGARAPIALTLAPGLARGAGESQKIVAPPGEAILELTLEAGAERYPSYQASLSNLSDQGAETLTYSRLSARAGRAGREVVVPVPTAALPAADYLLTLAGLDANSAPTPIGKYYFSLRREK